VIIDYQLYLSK